jgi:hypothetical protein
MTDEILKCINAVVATKARDQSDRCAGFTMRLLHLWGQRKLWPEPMTVVVPRPNSR